MVDRTPSVAARTVTILSGQTVSDAESLRGVSVIGLITPAALTSVALTFQVSADGAIFVALTDAAGAAVSVTVAPNRGIWLNPQILMGWRNIKVVGGTAEGADRIITLLVRNVAG